jgi:hypothetical protein
MIGAGTDNECVQIPNNQGMDANYIRPDSLLPFNDLISKLQHPGDEQIAGKKAAHYGGKVASIGKWKNAKIDVWQDATTKALLKLTMHASGDDPFFNSGSGTLDAAYQVQQIEGWIPIFLFAMLFGLSMDYEVFLVTRMRESWDHVEDNARAVAHGLERTGRIITAAALIMVAAFSGFDAARPSFWQDLLRYCRARDSFSRGIGKSRS